MLAAFATLTVAGPASASGGLFRDAASGDTPEATRETVIFARDGELVELHLQLQYAGDPRRFAWLIPVQSAPEISAGSAQLFANLVNATTPVPLLATSVEFCPVQEDTRGCGVDLGSDSPPMAGGGFSGSPPSGPLGPGRVRKSVGSFEYEILSGGSAAIESWLAANGFATNHQARAVVDDYAARGHVFAAIRLAADAGLAEIHPLVLRYRGRPTLPLRLTAFASREDTAVRVFFLGQQRAVPVGEYRHVSVNVARLDWQNRIRNLEAVAGRAVDAPGADGRAFVTEYAGPSSNVDRNQIAGPWNPSVFVLLDASEVLNELIRQGLLVCITGLMCEEPHQLVLTLLRRYLPAPDGVDELAFWRCVDCYEDRFDPATFDGQAFARDLEELIVKPGRHADELLARSSYITRLFTRISPAEMTADPEFAELPSGNALGDVPLATFATDRTTCDLDQVLIVPDGREVAHSPGQPALFTEAMPWAEFVDEFSPDGTRTRVTDLSATIGLELTAHNTRLGYDPDSEERAELARTSNGCACQVRAASGQGVAFALLALIAALRRARRSAARPRARA